MPNRTSAQVMLLILFAVFALGVSTAAVGLCDFRAPTTDLTQLFLAMNYTYLDTPDTPQVDVSSGRFSFTFARVHDEPDRALSVGSTSEFTLHHLSLDRALGDAYFTTRFYLPQEDPLYVFAEVKADYTATSGQSGLELRAGAGYGRLTDVTPLAKALRIQETLTEDLVLETPLPDEAIQEIAKLIAQETQFSGIGELVSRIESVIEAASGADLNTRALLIIAEQIRSTDAAQQCGWALQAGIGYELVRRFGGSRLLLFTLSTDIARPLSLASRVEAHADFSRPLFVSGANALSVSLHYNRRLSNTTRLVAEYALQRVQQATEALNVGETIELQWVFDLGRMDLTVSGSLTRGSGMSGWVEALVVSARVDLL